MPLKTAPSGILPLYIFPSIPFRRRSSASTNQSNAGPTSPTSPLAPRSPATPPTETYLSGAQSMLRCDYCYTHLCPTSAIISKGFTGRHGRAYLVAPPTHSMGSVTPPDSGMIPRHHQAGNLPNIHVHKPQPRQLQTGAHTVCDISCSICGQILGWKYVAAEAEGQKYKVGMFILETEKVTRSVDWDNEDPAAGMAAGRTLGSTKTLGSTRKKGGKRENEHERKDSAVGFEEEKDDEIEFDSQDEDECEDLFMGIWSPELAKRRRRAKAWKDDDIV